MAQASGRGSAGRAPDSAATRSPITRPIVARTADRSAIRRAAYSKRLGRDRKAWTSQDTPSLARKRRCMARSYASKARRCPPTCGVDRRGRQLGRDERPVQALARERVEEPGGIADEQPARACASASRGGRGARPRRRRRCGRPFARRRCRPSVGGMAATIPSATAAAPRRVRARPPRASEHDAHVHPSSGDRGDADVAVVEHQHPRVAFGRRVWIAEVVREADRAARGAEGRATPVVVATIERSPSAPTTTSARSRSTSTALRPRTSRPPLTGSNAVTVQPHRTSAPGPSRDGRGAPDRAPSDRSRPPARHPLRCRTSAGTSSRPASRRAWPGCGRATARQGRLVEAGPLQRAHGGWGGEDAAVPAIATLRRARRSTTSCPHARKPRCQDRPGRPTAHDRDLDIGRCHSPTPIPRCGSGSTLQPGTAAIA